MRNGCLTLRWRFSWGSSRPGSARGCSAAAGELPEHPLDALGMSAALGLGLLALACLAIGEAGKFNLAGLTVLMAVATEVGLLAGLKLLRALWQAWFKSPEPRAGAGSVIDRIMFGLLALTLAATALAAMAPVTDGDALCYHLQVPKVFLVRQAVFFDADLHETIYPLLTEMLYALALEFRGPVACRCVQWLLGLVFAANVTALARPSLGRRLVGWHHRLAGTGGDRRHGRAAQRRGPGGVWHRGDRGLDETRRPPRARRGSGRRSLRRAGHRRQIPGARSGRPARRPALPASLPGSIMANEIGLDSMRSPWRPGSSA